MGHIPVNRPQPAQTSLIQIVPFVTIALVAMYTFSQENPMEFLGAETQPCSIYQTCSEQGLFFSRKMKHHFEINTKLSGA